ncbi:MAG: endonuclease MutS2 [Acidobacteria bacterium]|nr:endonuclease MutS2 [Acidobacteriota bacterium]
MPTDALQLLEFPDLLHLLEGYVGSPLGKARLWDLISPQEEAAVAARLQMAAEAREYVRSTTASEKSSGGKRSEAAPIGRTIPLDFSAFSDPGPILDKARLEGTTLEIAEIAEVLGFAERASEIRQALTTTQQRFPRLAEEAARINNFHPLVHALRGKVLPSGELDDHASPALYRIRREIEKQRASILSSLRNFLRDQAEESPGQEEIITVRGDRFVVPVRAQRKSQVKGVVHGSSSSGQTVYVEPLEAIDLNNELVSLREEEGREIHRILRELTARVREQTHELAEAAAGLGVLDLAFGCGRYARDYDCAIPRFGDGLLLKDARHPLLAALFRKTGAQVVPLSLTLQGQDRVLVISGPNTGGKTVALKTVGLLALMAAAGLPVPAAEAEFPRFDHVLADIGDYQSIQESLSTFSAHLLNISSMLQAASRDSLVLLDELGTATDPEEAGALGVAIVDRFRSSGAFTIASTHHLAVKAYATNTPGVLSGSMGFDEQTLEPTYRLLLGRPGKSSGLAIAQRLGLPQDVLERARQSLSQAHQEVERFLSHLREEEDAAARLRAELQERLAALARQEKEWMENLRQRQAQQTAEWQRQLEELARTFQERVEQKLRDIALKAESNRRAVDAQKEAARLASRFREHAADELRQSWVSHIGGAEGEQPAPQQEPEIGDRVRLKSFSTLGLVRSKTADWLELEMGHLRTRVPRQEVAEVIPAAPGGKAPPASKISVRVEKIEGSSLSEINVIGETAEDARQRVDKFLDNAFLAQVSRVRVVHGSGKGILRRALAEMLSEHPQVENFFPAPQEEGGAGATIVELKV